jgi:hypothetical protein
MKENISKEYKEIKLLLKWFTRQAVAIQCEILHKIFMMDGIEVLEMLLNGIEQGGFADECSYRSSFNIGEKAAKKMSDRRRARAKEKLSHRAKLQAWLNVNIGKIFEWRRMGLSWRAIAELLNEDFSIQCSHTTLYNYWRSYNAKK